MKHDNRRKYFRSGIIAPARWQHLTDREIKLVNRGLGNRLLKKDDIPSPIDEFAEEAVPGSEEEGLLRCLQLLNNKLDFVIEQNFLREKGNPPSRGDVIDLSGSGLKFSSEEYLKAGTLLKMDLIISGTFQYSIEFIASVVRAEETENGFVIAGKIIEIGEEARDSIVKVVLQKQRLEIRRDKNKKGKKVGKNTY